MPTFPLVNASQYLKEQSFQQLYLQTLTNWKNTANHQNLPKTPEKISTLPYDVPCMKRSAFSRSFSLDNVRPQFNPNPMRPFSDPSQIHRSAFSTPNLSPSYEDFSINNFIMQQNLLQQLQLAQRQSEINKVASHPKSPPNSFNTINIQNYNNYNDIHNRHVVRSLSNEATTSPLTFHNINHNEFSVKSEQSAEALGNEADDNEDSQDASVTLRKKSTRALTGRHVRSGTGASPLTLQTLRLKINGKQNQDKSATPTTSKSVSKRGRKKQLTIPY